MTAYQQAEHLAFLIGTLRLADWLNQPPSAKSLELLHTEAIRLCLTLATKSLPERRAPNIVGINATNPRVLERLAQTGPSLQEDTH